MTGEVGTLTSDIWPSTRHEARGAVLAKLGQMSDPKSPVQIRAQQAL